MALTFDRVLAADWSARSKPSPRRETRDAIYACEARHGRPGVPAYHRTRDAALEAVVASLDEALEARERVLVGLDFAFGSPSGLARALTGRDEALAVWDWLADRIEDGPSNANNRFAVAAAMNARLPGLGPFWGRPAHLSIPGLPDKGSQRWGHGLPDRRATDRRASTAQSPFKLFTTGSVGSRSLLGLPRLAALRRRYGDSLAAWPLEGGWVMPEAPVVVVEIYPALHGSADPGPALLPGRLADIPDAAQVLASALALASAGPNDFSEPPGLDDPSRVAREEGWIFRAT